MATTPKTEKPEAKPEPLTVAGMKQVAHDYAVPFSDGTLDKLKDEKGVTPDHFEEMVKTMAMGLYPTLAPQIKAGIKTAFLLDPYRQIAKKMVGEDYEPQFDSNPQDAAALQGGTDPATGHPAPMSLSQWQQHIKSSPGFGYQYTPAAHQEAQSALQGIAQEMNAPPQGATSGN